MTNCVFTKGLLLVLIPSMGNVSEGSSCKTSFDVEDSEVLTLFQSF